MVQKFSNYIFIFKETWLLHICDWICKNPPVMHKNWNSFYWSNSVPLYFCTACDMVRATVAICLGYCGHLSAPMCTQLGCLCLRASLTQPPSPLTIVVICTYLVRSVMNLLKCSKKDVLLGHWMHKQNNK